MLLVGGWQPDHRPVEPHHLLHAPQDYLEPLVEAQRLLRGRAEPVELLQVAPPRLARLEDRKSTRLNSSHANISYAVFCLKKKTPSRFARNFVTSAPASPLPLADLDNHGGTSTVRPDPRKFRDRTTSNHSAIILGCIYLT